MVQSEKWGTVDIVHGAMHSPAQGQDAATAGAGETVAGQSPGCGKTEPHTYQALQAHLQPRCSVIT